MNLVYASPPPRRARNRDSQAEIETRVYVRPTPHAWSNVFLVPWTPNDPPLPWTPAAWPAPTVRAVPAVRSVRAVQAVQAVPAAQPAATLTVAKRRRRSMLPWVVFLAAFGIAFGIGRDRALRAELASELRVATAKTLAALETSAMRLGRQVVEGR